MWKELVQKLDSQAEFAPPVSLVSVARAERSLGIPLSDELKNLLFESNGIQGEYGLGLVWPIERIVEDNLSFRRNPDFKGMYMPFEPLLLFADAGNGDQFAFKIVNASLYRADIFIWNHEDDSRTWVAASLKNYLEGWLSGKLKI